MRIITNHVPRRVFYGGEVPYHKQRNNFDFLSDEEYDASLFFEYQGFLILFGNFYNEDLHDFPGWHQHAIVCHVVYSKLKNDSCGDTTIVVGRLVG